MPATPDPYLAQLHRIPGFEVGKRVVALGILVLIMTIPLAMIGDLVSERSGRRQEVAYQIAGQWGGGQTIGGPVLTIPYVTRSEHRRADGTIGVTVTERAAFFLPEKLEIAAEPRSDIRRRSLHEVLVYTAHIRLAGQFAAPDFAPWKVPAADIKWDEAILSFGVGDIGGIVGMEARFADRPLRVEPGLSGAKLFPQGMQGLQARIAGLQAGRPHGFSIDLSLNGSGFLQFLPLGDATAIDMKSDWPHPGFIGTALPQTRTIAADGFGAHWQSTALSRPYPGQWRSGDPSPDLWAAVFGVELAWPGDVYQQSDRIVKYGLLMVGLAFAAIFVVGLLTGARAHMVQYLLVGGSICIFYLLVLALAEQIRFDFAYGIASTVNIAAVSLYVGRTIRRMAGLVAAAVLSVIHGWMFMLLQMEDAVLLSGTVGLLLALIAVMYVTRNVDWFQVGLAPVERKSA
jgi:inner membrane protein